MPYVTQDRRNYFRPGIKQLDLAMGVSCTPGDLNYILTRLVLAYINARGKNYTHINDAVGALECAKLELYRRLATPYEDTKIAQNGDVYL